MLQIVIRGMMVAVMALALTVVPSLTVADEAPTKAGAPDAREAQFIASIQSDLGARFAHAADATSAGYVRYTDEDDTGAISYANRQWVSDPTHPSQLWYDKDGNLLGADFSVPRPHGEPRPTLWGVDPGRWVEFDGHVHWVTRNSDTGAVKYDALWNNLWTQHGGSVNDPSPETVVAVGEAKTASEVITIFEFPTIWDLIVWIKPNPSGAFADKNPTVRR